VRNRFENVYAAQYHLSFLSFQVVVRRNQRGML